VEGKETFHVVQAALDKLVSNDPAVHAALGITSGQAGLFWTALNAVTEESGREIPNLNKLAKKTTKVPSVMINELKKRGVLERGSKRGEWLLTKRILKKLNSMVTGEALMDEASHADEREAVTNNEDASPPELPKALAKKTVGQLYKDLASQRSAALTLEANAQQSLEEARKAIAEIDGKMNTLRTLLH
jgi:hypothetical protein